MDNKHIDEQIWRLQAVKQGIMYGAQSRERSRAQYRRSSENKALKIIKQYQPEWLQATGQTIPLEDVEALLKLMTPVATTADDHKFMHNFVCHSLARGIDKQRLINHIRV
jgi:predicted nucleotidyltransferase